MNDRELLEAAARAAGLLHVDYTNLNYDGKLGLQLVDSIGRHTASWNPLEDDGDALRLAVKLSIGLDFVAGSQAWAGRTDEMLHEFFNDNPYAATRRAIVRAAAMIGSKNNE
jgi:hypothetical protein